jgi:CO dehydrogenase/acetyl-CoA synthase gamma subunit (corrinoid Fe-S protein)
MNYKIDPGLYCVGNPDSTSVVLVTANYKMSFDSLRK